MTVCVYERDMGCGSSTEGQAPPQQHSHNHNNAPRLRPISEHTPSYPVVSETQDSPDDNPTPEQQEEQTEQQRQQENEQVNTCKNKQ